MHALAATACALALISGQAHAAEEPVIFAMDEYGWEIEQTPDSCTARAQFSSGSRQALLQLVQHIPSTYFEVRVVGTGLQVVDGEPRVAVSPVQTGLAANRIRPIASGNVGGAAFTLAPRPPAGEPGRPIPQAGQAAGAIAAGLQFMEIEGLFSEPVRLETGSSTGFMPGMDRCTDALVASWGLDPTEQRTLSRRATPVDPPAQAEAGLRFSGARTPRQYEAELIVLINDDGRVTECRTIPADALLDKEVGCRQMKRDVRYKPALNASGQPVASYAKSTMFFTSRP